MFLGCMLYLSLALLFLLFDHILNTNAMRIWYARVYAAMHRLLHTWSSNYWPYYVITQIALNIFYQASIRWTAYQHKNERRARMIWAYVSYLHHAMAKKISYRSTAHIYTVRLAVSLRTLCVRWDVANNKLYMCHWE